MGCRRGPRRCADGGAGDIRPGPGGRISSGRPPAEVGLRWRRTRGSGDGNTPCNSQGSFGMGKAESDADSWSCGVRLSPGSAAGRSGVDAPPGGADGKDHLQGGGHPPAEIPSHPGRRDRCGDHSGGTAAAWDAGLLRRRVLPGPVHPSGALFRCPDALVLAGPGDAGAAAGERGGPKAVGTGESSCGQGPRWGASWAGTRTA